MKLLGDGLLTYGIEHPCDCDRLLFLNFNPCLVLKNVHSRFLAHDLGPKRDVLSGYIKKLYELQKDLVVKPVRYLSRKHVYPNNIEKINVARAIQVLSPDVTAALEHLRNQAGHTSSDSFADAGQTVIFLQNTYRWFVLHDPSNTTQHIQKKWPDTRQFDDAEDARLEWSEDNPILQNPLSTLVKYAVPALCRAGTAYSSMVPQIEPGASAPDPQRLRRIANSVTMFRWRHLAAMHCTIVDGGGLLSSALLTGTESIEEALLR
ncbi:hypothetical protein HPB49_014536 [Dermacentor silvarum]|uniref:Uncharacterized protein n=1 Tax=Dermacentor silvarum TaxID=543639 RepID=A0ACB8CXU9_DERSI|nr:hypothetical protein HPB49_014536 [Dermacentor silvarum]